MNRPAADGRKITKSRVNKAPGRVVRIDLGDGRCAYGRVLDVLVEFYDRIGQPGEAIDLIELVTSPVAFTINVTNYAFRRRGGWELLDVVALTGEELSKVYYQAHQDAISGAISMSWYNHAGDISGEAPATFDECQNLETCAVWDPHHVEDRLRDHFNGRPNMWVESLRLKP
jgi:hypothetical protein